VQYTVWTFLSKLTLEEIEPETLRRTHFKISKQPLGQPQMNRLLVSPNYK